MAARLHSRAAAHQRLWLLSLLLPSVATFGSLFSKVIDRTFLAREALAVDACKRCHERLGHTLNETWQRCVTDDLIQRQESAKATPPNSEQKGPTHYPVDSDEFNRLRPGGRYGDKTDELMNIMRNYSCEVADGGTQPLRKFTWNWQPSDPCANRSRGGGGGAIGDDGSEHHGPEFAYTNGFLPAGNDLYSRTITEEAAKLVCAKDEQCAGYTFSADSAARTEAATHNMLFKSSAEGATVTSGWHTWRKLRTLDCSADARQRRSTPVALTVHVLRESPPVYVVDDFVTDAECEAMLAETLPKMGRSVVGGGGTSSWRQSYSVNMVPDFEWEDHLITRIARRKFAFARDVAGYDVVEGVGQEPVNAVYYKNDGDQYRPHCDGECHGSPYTLGARVASSLAYCEVADRGGYTLFTRSALKMVPRKRQMLFFGYFFKPGSTAPGTLMDDGHTEHTGCPTHEGRKWIATMWYREGVTPEKDWAYYSARGRAGV